jgi:hypothetical protein
MLDILLTHEKAFIPYYSPTLRYEKYASIIITKTVNKSTVELTGVSNNYLHKTQQTDRH